MCPLKNIFIFQFGVTDELRGQIVVYYTASIILKIIQTNILFRY